MARWAIRFEPSTYDGIPTNVSAPRPLRIRIHESGASGMAEMLGQTAEAADGAETEDVAGFGFEPRTELGRLILAARREFLAANGRFLSREELERELAERRGASYRSDDE